MEGVTTRKADGIPPRRSRRQKGNVMKNWSIDQIEAMAESEAQEMALETMQIKGHNVYFVDFEGYFKYSALVFMDGMHIHYANDYELHHPDKTREELRGRYIETMNHKLYTEDEIVGPVSDYDDYKAKDYFLRNYYGMRRKNVSIFYCGPKEAKPNTAGMIYDPVAFAYFDDADFVKHHVGLLDSLEKSWKAKQDDYEFMKSAFISEMWNHEYAINWQGDYDVLSVFGNIHYDRSDNDLQNYFDQLDFTDTQRRAYLDARREYMRKANEMF